jgi:hypothetical protein
MLDDKSGGNLRLRNLMRNMEHKWRDGMAKIQPLAQD